MNPVWFILSIILLPLTTVQAGFSFLNKFEVIFKIPGETVVLSQSSVTPPITRITWKYDSNLAAEWNGGDVNFYQDFKGRSTLNTTTGELTISNLTLKDSGGYVVEINNEAMEIKMLWVICFSFLNKLEVIYKKPGETVVLSQSSVTPPIPNITWKLGTTMPEVLTLAAEWNGGDVNFHQDFKGRSTLNTTTGELTISNLTQKDSGSYVVEINNEAMEMKILMVVFTYKKPGETVVLSPGSVTPPITRITWKHDSNLAAEWNGGDVNFHQDFKGRSTLNTTTGELTISNLTLQDLGGYGVEINNEAMEIKMLWVVLPVTKPTISMSCDDEKTHCVLTCEVNTRDLGEVSYSWTLGDMVGWRQSEKIKITKEQKEPSLLCVVKNPVSYEFSDRVVNPFSNNP